MKTAAEHDKRDPVVSYYCRLYAMQKGMEIDRKSPECRQFLVGLMNALEQTKKEHREMDAIQNEIVGQAHLENYALKLFLYADNEDRAARFGKNVVKSFYTAGMLMDVLGTFGPLSEDIEKNRKYAKWKAAYIHNCLKNGETPISGPLADDDMNAGDDPISAVPERGNSNQVSHSASFGQQNEYPGMPAAAGSWSNNQPIAASASDPRYDQSSAARTQADWQPAKPPGAGTYAQLKSEDYTKAMKFCKFATSALQYEDAKTAIENLTKALNLLSTGRE